MEACGKRTEEFPGVMNLYMCICSLYVTILQQGLHTDSTHILMYVCTSYSAVTLCNATITVLYVPYEYCKLGCSRQNKPFYNVKHVQYMGTQAGNSTNHASTIMT